MLTILKINCASKMQNIIYESGYDSEWLETNIFDDSIIASKAPLT